MNYKAFVRSLQVTSAVTIVGSFSKQKFPRCGRCREGEPLRRAFVDPLLYCCELQLNDPTQLRFAEPTEHHHFVNAVHKLRRELPPGSFDSSAINLLIQLARQ